MTDEVDNFLEHFGVKGMRWGVRKKRDTSDEEPMSPELEKHIRSTPTTPPTAAEKRRIAESQAKHDARYNGSEADSPKGWRPTGKQVAIAAVGAIAVAGILYKVKTGKSLPSTKGFSVEEYMSAVRSEDSPGWLKDYAGKHMSIGDFKGISQTSIDRVWRGNYITKELFSQKELTFDPGHEFFRVSHRVETSFSKHTFATASKEDGARYFLGWKEQTTNLINFKAKEPVRIPDLHTTLEATREHLVSMGGKPTPADVIEKLNMFAGSDWTSPNAEAIAQRLMAKGYHGVIDHMDQGVYGETPLVLFDSSRFGPKVTTLRENVDVAEMEKVLADLVHRR